MVVQTSTQPARSLRSAASQLRKLAALLLCWLPRLLCSNPNVNEKSRVWREKSLLPLVSTGTSSGGAISIGVPELRQRFSVRRMCDTEFGVGLLLNNTFFRPYVGISSIIYQKCHNGGVFIYTSYCIMQRRFSQSVWIWKNSSDLKKAGELFGFQRQRRV